MKALTLRCKDCGNIKHFEAMTSDEVIRKLDKSGWLDAPDENGNIIAICPNCIDNEVSED